MNKAMMIPRFPAVSLVAASLCEAKTNDHDSIFNHRCGRRPQGGGYSCPEEKIGEVLVLAAFAPSKVAILAVEFLWKDFQSEENTGQPRGKKLTSHLRILDPS